MLSSPSVARLGAAETLISGRYLVQRKLGAGGMASVFAVLDQASGEEIALKRLAPSASARQVALFEREFYTLAGLRHPHIVEVYEYGIDESPYYTMERLRGTDLHAEAPVPWRRACAYLRDVATTIGLLHARRLVHRDISPRNIWLTSHGAIKLLDFGALAPFGVADELAGTPPFVPPEALHGQPLDQRADLYALGALAYWLLTGRYAYHARALSALYAAWERPVEPASKRVAALTHPDLPEVPRELDALLESLLSLDPSRRPGSTAELLDRLHAIAGFEREIHEAHAEAYLQSKAFVGRSAERDRMLALLAGAMKGAGGSVIIESEEGMGRTRLLEEVGLRARVSGATVLHAEGSRPRAYGVAEALAMKLLDALPEPANRAAAPNAAVLGQLSERVRARLGQVAHTKPRAPLTTPEGRILVQGALLSWFVAVSREHTLLLLIDDLQDVDEASVAWLASLAASAKQEALLVVSTRKWETAHALESTAAYAMAQRSMRIPLGPLGPSEVRDLLGSLFGPALHLARMAEHLCRVSGGHPAYCLELAEDLVRRGVVRHVDGLWLLPAELEGEQLPTSRSEVLSERLDRLPETARHLGQTLSIHEGAVPLTACTAVSEYDVRTTFYALEALTREGVLVGSAEGYRFAHEYQQRMLAQELDEDRRCVAHRKLAEAKLAAGHELNALERLHIGLHLLRGGEQDRGAHEVVQASIRLALFDLAHVGAAVRPLEEALVLFRSAGRTSYELLAVLGCLTAASHFSERRHAAIYGEASLRLLQEATGIKLALKLRPFLGRVLGLYVALAIAGIRFKLQAKNPLVPKFHETLRLFTVGVSSLAGVAAITIDPARAIQLAKMVEPLRALGKNHLGSLVYDFCVGLSYTVQDRPGRAAQHWSGLLEKLEAEPVKRKIPAPIHLRLLTATLYACGVLETWRDGTRALQFADSLDRIDDKLYAMNADQLRMMYYAHRGDAAQYQTYRARVETHAIQRGSAWQFETWASGASIAVHQRTYNAMGMKRDLAELERLSKEVPTLSEHVKKAMGVYLLLRERYAEALPWLENILREVPLLTVGWARGHGALAQAYNALGLHARAKEVCQRAIARLTPEDLMFPAMNLAVQIELAMAEAGLGNHMLAASQLDALLAKHEPNEGPLTLGALHEARAKIALLAREMPRYAHHLLHMERWYKPSGIAPLLARSSRLEKARLQRESQRGSTPPIERVSLRPELVHALQQLHTAPEDYAARVLSTLASLCRTAEIHLFMLDDDNQAMLASSFGGRAPDCLLRGVSLRLTELRAEAATQVLEPQAAQAALACTFGCEDKTYRLELLTTPEDIVVGGLVFATTPDQKRPSHRLLEALAERLQEKICSATSLDPTAQRTA